ncbi:MAG: hypothetical protein A2328_10355 [Bdellovibrionales bacterium RIFOXYB2_FULL_36_6]|nr:MAG: hypothetical protein A2328_10355 [Bdellovibrionales bacterium RIFOXYB2_FULL_36_6]
MDDKLEESLRIYTRNEKETSFIQPQTPSRIDLAKAAVEKYISGLEIEIADITSAMKFVGFSKTKISKAYVEKFYQGNKGAALDNFVNGARIKFEEGLAKPELQNLAKVLSGKSTTDELKRIKAYCDDENPWLWRVISPYISTTRDEEPKHLTHLFGG